MKRIIAVLLCAAMLLCFASCGSSTTASVAANDVALTSDGASSVATSTRTIRIMPLGDSLTAGYPDTCAYRNYLCDQLLENGYNFTFVGPYNTNADRMERYNLPEEYSHHAGVGGRTLQGVINAEGEILTEANTPDIILLMITTNDMGDGWLNEQLEEQYRQLVADIFRAYPDVTLYAANPLPKLTGDSTTSTAIVEELNTRVTQWEIPFLKQLAADKTENGYDMHYVDMTNAALGFVPTDINNTDKIHPLDSGNDKLANAWFNAMKPTLDKLAA